MNIPLFISTFGRPEMTVKSLKSLAASNLPDFVDVFITDDGTSLRTVTDHFAPIAHNNGWHINRLPHIGGSAAKFNPAEAIVPSQYGNAEYIAFSDSDMIYAKNWLQTLLTMLESDKEIGAVCGMYPTRNIRAKYTFESKGDHKSIFPLCPNTFIIRKEFYNPVTFRQTDWVLALSTHVVNAGSKIGCMPFSVVQHEGIRGQNSRPNNYEVGLNFAESLADVPKYENRRKQTIAQMVYETPKLTPKTSEHAIYIYDNGDVPKITSRTPGTDYICFSDKNTALEAFGWRRGQLPMELKLLNEQDRVVALKLLPHMFLPHSTSRYFGETESFNGDANQIHELNKKWCEYISTTRQHEVEPEIDTVETAVQEIDTTEVEAQEVIETKKEPVKQAKPAVKKPAAKKPVVKRKK